MYDTVCMRDVILYIHDTKFDINQIPNRYL